MSGALARIWVAVAGVCAGALYADSHDRFWPPLTVALVGGCGLLLRRSAVIRVVSLGAVAAGVVAATAAAREHHSTVASIASDVPLCEASGVVREQAGALGTIVALDALACEGRPAVSRPGVVVVDTTLAQPGATVAGRGLLVPLSDDAFGGARRRLGADAALERARLHVVAGPSGVLAAAASVRASLREALEAIDDDQGALLRGLTIGDTSALEPSTVESFRRSGLSHLLAVSGSNVAIVLGATYVVTARLGLRVRFLVALASLWGFVIVVGPDPSVLRAGAMGTIALTAIVSGRRSEPLHALGLALIALVTLRPGLVLSIGLHLSVAATAGIVLWSDPLKRALRRLPGPLRMGLGATLAAQAAVAPILAGTFGELSLAGPVANVLALPAVPFATVLGLGAGVAQLASSTVGEALARAAAPFAWWISTIGTNLGPVGWAAVEVPSWTGWALAAPLVLGAARSLRNL